MLQSSHRKDLRILAGLGALICACSLPLYPQTLHVATAPEEEMPPVAENLPLEAAAPAPTLAPTEPTLPPGGLIILETDRDGNREIYSLHADGSNPVNLSNNILEDSLVECSPDGQRVLYATQEDDKLNLYVMGIWGQNKQLTFVFPGQEVYGIWVDPDAIYLDVYNNTVDTTYLATYQAGAWELQEVTEGAGADLIPKYRHFEGAVLETRVENYGETDLDFEIYLTEGSQEKNLTNNPAWDMAPMWSEDGRTILFSSMRNGENNDLFLMDREGTILRQLTQSDSDDTAYCWIHK